MMLKVYKWISPTRMQILKIVAIMHCTAMNTNTSTVTSQNRIKYQDK